MQVAEDGNLSVNNHAKIIAININILSNQKAGLDFDLPDFPSQVLLSSTVRFNSTIYFFGGLALKSGAKIDNYEVGSKPEISSDNFSADARLVTLDLSTYKWEKVAHLKNQDVLAKLVVLGEDIYSFGGFRQDESGTFEFSQKVKKFDFEILEWKDTNTSLELKITDIKEWVDSYRLIKVSETYVAIVRTNSEISTTSGKIDRPNFWAFDLSSG